MKKISIILCFIVCLFGLTACNSETPVDADVALRLESMSQAIIEGAFAPLTAAQASALVDMGPEYMEYVYENSMGMAVDGNRMITAYNSWNKAIEEIGAYQEITGYDVKYNSKGDGMIVIAHVTCERGTGQVETVFKDDLNNTVESMAFNINYSFGEKMGRAGLNTLLGMGTVFVVLILISLIISLFNYIPRIQEAFAKKDQSAEAETADGTKEAESFIEDGELSDDEELVAVISAAICAYESAGTPVSSSGDGFVVRSIRRKR